MLRSQVFLKTFRNLSVRPSLATLRPVLITSSQRYLATVASKAMSPTDNKVLHVNSLNPHVVKAEYAVRGLLAIRAEQYKERLASGDKSLPFSEIVHCNIGNPQQLQQKPITFLRQVSALLQSPHLLDESIRQDVEKLFPADAIERAKTLHKAVGSIGAYSHSKGALHIRRNVAKFIEERDGYPSDPELIFLTAGASDGVKAILNLIIADSKCGVFIPMPQYPLYSASMALLNGTPLYYELDESADWSLSIDKTIKTIEEQRAHGIDVRAIVVINPGNPTGQCLSLENMRQIIDLCKKYKLVLLADEVYQTNVYDKANRPFYSFKHVLKSMGAEYDSVELFSFHSVSKGMIGECGQRGGYFECTGIDNEVVEQLYKIASISLCPPVQGQVIVDLMVNPPKKGDPSYKLYNEEVTSTYESLRRRAVKLVEALRKLEGVTCNYAQGAMYVFPQVRLPAKAVDAAKEANLSPDTFYSLAMLDATGVCVVPGSGFGQVDGTYHFRSTILPPEEKFDTFIDKISKFHASFMNKYR